MPADRTLLVLNCGSSSVKAAWFRADASLKRIGSGIVENIGTTTTRLLVTHDPADVVRDESLEVLDHDTAIDLLLTHVETWELVDPLVAVGHRIVHGGADFDQPRVIDEKLIARLGTLVSLAPMHLPQNLAGIAEANGRWPGLLQIGCFDTAFHRSLPTVARMTGLPQELHGAGIRRYGFHGLSYESILENLAQHEGASAATGRIVIAHLGSGASMAAIKDGQSVETTMGFSTLGGLLMATRCGDMDPGILLYLLNENLISLAGAQDLLYEKSGLIGVSGVSSDMRELLENQRQPQVLAAINLFCYSARKHLAALTAVLGGLDRLVFTGGIGENSAEIRQRICTGLSYLGIDLDPDRNQRRERVISPPDSPVVVNVIPTNEELTIAQHTYRLSVSPHHSSSANGTPGPGRSS